MIDMVRRHEIQVLRRAGHSLVETAKLVGVSKRTVERVDGELKVESFDTPAEREKRRIGRPSKAEPFRSFLVSELMAQPDVLAVELRRARNKGYTGGKSALYELVSAGPWFRTIRRRTWRRIVTSRFVRSGLTRRRRD